MLWPPIGFSAMYRHPILCVPRQSRFARRSADRCALPTTAGVGEPGKKGSTTMIIRRELLRDQEQITRVHYDAFAVEYPDNEPVEPRLVTTLRASTAWIPALSLVAVRDEQIVGHVCCTRGTEPFPTW